MKTLVFYSSAIQSNMTSNYLNSKGIDAFSRGSREYASIVTGVDQGRYEILVPEHQFLAAQKLLQNVNLKLVENDPVVSKQMSNNEANFNLNLKKVVIYFIASVVILPVMFNILSLIYLYKYSQGESAKASKVFWLTTMLPLNFCVPIFITVYNLSWTLRLLKDVF